MEICVQYARTHARTHIIYVICNITWVENNSLLEMNIQSGKAKPSDINRKLAIFTADANAYTCNLIPSQEGSVFKR